MQFDQLERREFITLLGGAASAWPLVVRAQQPTHVARIGYVSGTGSAADRGPFVEALQQGMREHGYVDGKDFIIEYRGSLSLFWRRSAQLTRIFWTVSCANSSPLGTEAEKRTREGFIL